ncbi:MAG: EAL domain-containing protein [Myxococcota bacterium]
MAGTIHSETSPPAATSWVLVVDDEPGVRKIVARLLKRMGLLVEQAASGEEATAAMDRHDYAAVISDIAMPGMDGMALLREVRKHDYDVPVILITGRPSFESAVAAIEYGAFHYFVKPFDNDEFRRVISRAIQLGRIARAKRHAMDLLGTGKAPSDRAGLASSFERALDMLWMAFQPIIHAHGEHEVYGYECLLRSDEPSLPHPEAVISAAEQLDRLPELGRIVRERAAKPFFAENGDTNLFVNLHPQDLMDPQLDDPRSDLTRIAAHVVLEITERASLQNLEDVRARLVDLRGVGFRIAVDDLGAGYAGLTSLATLQPEIVKIDMSLIRDVHTDSTRRRLVKSLTGACKEMDILVVAEGIETAEERDTVVELGCDLLQGFRFARPGRAFPQPVW